MRPLLSGLISVLCLQGLAATLAAQEPAAPPRPILTVSCDGPAKFHAAFLATNVGGLLAAKEAESLLLPWQRVFFQSLGTERESLWPLLRDYRGRADLVMYSRPLKDRDSEHCALLRLRNDGNTDLSALAEQLDSLLRASKGEPVAVELDGTTRAALKHGRELVVLPWLRGNDLLIAWRQDGDGLLTHALDLSDRRAIAPAAGAATVDVELDLNQVIEVSLHGEGSSSRKMAELFGFLSLDTLHARLRPAGPQVLLELQCTFDPAPAGALLGLFPDVQGPPTLTHLVPPETPGWIDERVRTDHVAGGFIDVINAAFGGGQDRAEIDAAFKSEFGFHLFDDCLGHLGDEVLLLAASWGDDPGQRVNPINDTCVVFRIAAPKAFGEHWPDARDALFEAFEVDTVNEEDHGGVTVYGGTSSQIDAGVHMAVAGDLAMLAFGEEGRNLLKGALDRRRQETTALPAAVERVRRRGPPGFHGATLLDLETVFNGYFAKVSRTGNVFDIPMPLQQLAAALVPFGPLLEVHSLDHAVALSGFAENTWTLRFFW